MRDNFYVYTDSQGKMPVLRYKPIKSPFHRAFVRYVKNRPVECAPYQGQSQVWDYHKGEFVPIESVKKVHA